MIYIELNDESPDPETYHSALFTENASGRRELLRTLGLGKAPEIDSAWQAFLKAHPEKSEDAVLAAFASGSIFDEPLDSHPRQVVLDFGLGNETEHPFSMIGLFNQQNGAWHHIATFACACSLFESIDPMDDPKHRAPIHDLVIGTSSGESHVGRGYLVHETHFRMKDGALYPIIDFEKVREQCPPGSLYGPECTVSETRLEREMLANRQGPARPGFALVSMTGHPPTCEMCGLMLRNPTCFAFLWDEGQFRYMPTEETPVRCGWPLRDPKPEQSPTKQK